MALRVLFWNVQRKQLDGLVVPLVAAHHPDLLVLVENPPRSRISGLLATGEYARCMGNERFGVFTRTTFVVTREPGADGFDRADFWRIRPPGDEDWLVVVVHGPDRRNASDGTRRVFFRRVADHVRAAELRSGHRRTVICGDFNASPFDPSLVDADGLHAIGVKRFSGETDRGVRGHGRIDYFYNPMWRLYGTDPDGDAGAATHYHHDRQSAELCWHMLDQVLIRPEFAGRLREPELRIVREAGRIPLVRPDGRPDARRASDHLPVAFTLA